MSYGQDFSFPDLLLNSGIWYSYPLTDCHVFLQGWLILCYSGKKIMIFFVVCDLVFFKLKCFEFFQEYHPESQTVWIQIRPDVLSGLILVQTVCKGYQHTKPVGEVLIFFCVLLKDSFRTF